VHRRAIGLTVELDIDIELLLLELVYVFITQRLLRFHVARFVSARGIFFISSLAIPIWSVVLLFLFSSYTRATTHAYALASPAPREMVSNASLLERLDPLVFGPGGKTSKTCLAISVSTTGSQTVACMWKAQADMPAGYLSEESTAQRAYSAERTRHLLLTLASGKK
jgi:hypothetical protein